MDLRTVSVLTAAAEALRASAREHKRTADTYKRLARKQYAALDLIRVECDRLGIHLEITETPQHGGHSE